MQGPEREDAHTRPPDTDQGSKGRAEHSHPQSAIDGSNVAGPRASVPMVGDHGNGSCGRWTSGTGARVPSRARAGLLGLLVTPQMDTKRLTRALHQAMCQGLAITCVYVLVVAPMVLSQPVGVLTWTLEQLDKGEVMLHMPFRCVLRRPLAGRVLIVLFVCSFSRESQYFSVSISFAGAVPRARVAALLRPAAHQIPQPDRGPLHFELC